MTIDYGIERIRTSKLTIARREKLIIISTQCCQDEDTITNQITNQINISIEKLILITERHT